QVETFQALMLGQMSCKSSRVRCRQERLAAVRVTRPVRAPLVRCHGMLSTVPTGEPPDNHAERMHMPAVGIREVAQHAGVSIGTVSNVLNRPQVVSAKTLERVTASMQELGFVRNNLARQLKMGSGTTVGLVVLSLANPFFADLAEACEVVAEERGYTVVLGSSDQQPERQARYLDLFEEQRVAGMLIAPVAGMTEQMRHLRRRGMPHVLF